MKRSIAWIALIGLTMLPALWAADAWARAGGGSSSGSRGSRSYSAPAAPSSSPGSSSVSRPTPPPPTSYQQPVSRPGWGGMLGGLLLGGALGALLFGGGFGHGGIGLLEILLVAGLAYVAFSFMRRRAATAATAAPAGYADPGRPPTSWRPEPQTPSPAQSTMVASAPAAGADADLARGVAHIRQMDPGFDPARFGEPASDVFFRVQGAWMARDMSSVRAVLTEELHATMQAQCDQLRAQRRINRLENIAVRSVEVTEAWQESGQDFVTVRFLANLLDFTTDESGSRVIDGSRTEPVKFEEYWTFTRPVGPGGWRLTAIQQPG
jgi:predicted lipid-binding transport protein (Tim44 family)